MNINPLSIIPNIYENTGINAVQSSSNQLAANLQQIQNISSEPFNLQGLPTEIVTSEILKYLKPNDIKVFNEAEVYEKIDIYQNEITEWRRWQRKYPIGKEENRKLAVERMIDCIRKNEKLLNLSYLNLTSLPNLKSLESVDTLDFKGNNNEIIFDQFNHTFPNHFPNKKHGDDGFYNLIKTSCLPSGILEIELDAPYNHLNDPDHDCTPLHCGFIPPPTYNFEGDGNCCTPILYITRTGNPDTYPNPRFLAHTSNRRYTGNFEKDFLRLYRL